MEPVAKYNFKWKDLGDIRIGRPTLGPLTEVSVYRLMQYTFRDILEKRFGVVETKKIFFDSGYLAGQEFCRNVLDKTLDITRFVVNLTEKLLEFRIGILKVETADPETLTFQLTVSEDLDCSGLPIYGVTVCDYDEGFIAGILNIYTGRNFSVKEIDCWGTGERTCRFSVKLIN